MQNAVYDLRFSKAEATSTVLPAFWTRSRLRWLWIVLSCKAAFFAIALISVEMFSLFNVREYHNDPHWPREASPTLATRFATWDGAHYLLLSQDGYRIGSASCAFYPLWPYLIRLTSLLTSDNPFAAGLLLANVLSMAAFLAFHYFIEVYHGPEAASDSLALLLAFPAALYFSLIYTESLFLLLVVLFFLFMFQRHYLWAGAVGFLLPLTKAVGIFCVLPLLYLLWLRKEAPKAYLAYYGPVLGYISYFLIMYFATGNPFEGFGAQRFFPNHPSIGHIFDLPGSVRAFFRPLSLHGMQDSAIDRGLFLILIASLYPIYRLNPVYFVYAVLVGVVPALSSWFLSYTRNIMMCFPLFILFGTFLRGRERRRTLWGVIVVMAVIQIWFVVRQVNFIWVA